MQETSALYRQILATEPHWFETRVVIGESGDFTENELFSVRTSIQMFQEDPDIGKAIAQEIEVKMLNPSVDIPNMGMIVPYVRVCSENAVSEWIQQGVFYIDTREISDNNQSVVTITIHGFDAMLMAEQYYTDTGLDWSSGTVSDVDMIDSIASIMGIEVDSRTYDVANMGYRIPLPVSYTLREILGYIASMYAGCFIINEIGQLRLVSMLELPPETNLLIDQIGDYIVFGEDKIIV